MTPDILFENGNILVVNKPAGLVVHPDGRTDESTVVNWVLERYPELSVVGEPWHADMPVTEFPRAGIVHRLDRDTSGCLVVAKSQKSFEHLKKQFHEHTVSKTYHAFVYGYVKENDGEIDVTIGRSKNDFRKWSAGRGKKGKLREAVTKYGVLDRFDHKDSKFSFVEFRPKTGRTHQIRVHAKYVHHPIVADELYAGKLIKGESLGFGRQALHAHAVEFKGVDGEIVSVQAPYPDDFEQARLLAR